MSAATIALQGEEEEEEEERGGREGGGGRSGGGGGVLERAPAMRMRVDDLQKEVGTRHEQIAKKKRAGLNPVEGSPLVEAAQKLLTGSRRVSDCSSDRPVARTLAPSWLSLLLTLRILQRISRRTKV
jgi:hypothetical protein